MLALKDDLRARSRSRPKRRSIGVRAPGRRRCLGCLVLVLVLAGCACGSLPHDPRKTLQRVQQQHRLRVGLVENPPWVIRSGDEPRGAEVELVRRFAASLGASPDWCWGSEDRNLEALERFELDLLAGGLQASTPWAKKVGLTRPYFKERILVGVGPGSGVPASLEGLSVAVEQGDPAAEYLVRKNAKPVEVDRLSHFTQPAILAPDWRVAQLGFRATEYEAESRQHVMAVSPGENAWLKRLQEFLNREKSSMAGLLQQAAGAR
jgi:polar amino acid transport system substrate-binding protein